MPNQSTCQNGFNLPRCMSWRRRKEAYLCHVPYLSDLVSPEDHTYSNFEEWRVVTCMSTVEVFATGIEIVDEQNCA